MSKECVTKVLQSIAFVITAKLFLYALYTAYKLFWNQGLK